MAMRVHGIDSRRSLAQSGAQDARVAANDLSARVTREPVALPKCRAGPEEGNWAAARATDADLATLAPLQRGV